MKRDTEVILLALDFFADVRKGSAGPEAESIAKRIRSGESITAFNPSAESKPKQETRS